MATVDASEDTSDARPVPYVCRVCGEQFQTREEVVSHWRGHSAEDRARTSSRAQQRAARDAREQATGAPPRPRGRPRGSTAAPRSKAAPKPAPVNEVQLGLTLAYGLAGQAFSMFGPEPVEARQAVGLSISMTAIPAGRGLDHVAQKTPAYPVLRAVFGTTSALTELTPLAVPALVGVYAYAPNEVKIRLRPMTTSILGLILLQTFGPDVPPSPEELTPVAIPEWIRDLVNGLLPPPT